MRRFHELAVPERARKHSEVGHARASLGVDHHVGGFQVGVNGARPVGCGQRLDDLEGDVRRLTGVEQTPPRHLAQVLPHRALDDDVRRTLAKAYP